MKTASINAIIGTIISVVSLFETTTSFGHELIPVNLTLTPAAGATNRLDITLTAFNLSDTDTTSLSGSILAELVANVDVGGISSVDGLTLTGGTINATDIHLELATAIPPLTLATIDGKNMSGTPGTTAPPSIVTAGTFDAADHFLSINQGTIDIVALTGNSMIDLATAPISGAGAGAGTLGLSLFSAIGNERTYDVLLRFPISFTNTITDPVAADILVTGNIEATGRFTITVVPEPSGFVLLGLAVSTLAAVRVRLASGGRKSPVSNRSDFGRPVG